MFCGSILTSSLSGSCRRRPIEIVPRSVASKFGELLAADGAGRVDAGAGLVDDDVGHVRSATGSSPGDQARRRSSSVSRQAVPLPMAMTVSRYLRAALRR